jgi:quaternary ammonium compound-resistance protein SugE
MSMSWFYLVLAGVLEIGWPVGLKWAQSPSTRWQGIAVAVLFMAASGFFLWLAQRHISMGTASAASGTFLVGVMFFGDPSSLMRYLGVLLILAGVVTLKLAH